MMDNNKLDINKNGKPCIYYIKNIINNKIYIGSAIGHYRRKGQHFYMLRRNIHFNNHLQSSWNKYGEHNFAFGVLEFISNINLLQEREEYWIKLYKSFNNKKGYNSRTMCETNLHLKWPLESRIKFSLSKKGKKIKHLDYTAIAKMNMKKIKATNKITKEVRYFNSSREAASVLNIDRTSISKALHRTIKSSGGFYWDFIEQSVSNNSVNSEKVQKDNSDPSSMNDLRVIEKEQRLIGEESTNNPDTSAEHPGINLQPFMLYFPEKWMII